jgi:hypothetical protein
VSAVVMKNLLVTITAAAAAAMAAAICTVLHCEAGHQWERHAPGCCCQRTRPVVKRYNCQPHHNPFIVCCHDGCHSRQSSSHLLSHGQGHLPCLKSNVKVLLLTTAPKVPLPLPDALTGCRWYLVPHWPWRPHQVHASR